MDDATGAAAGAAAGADGVLESLVEGLLSDVVVLLPSLDPVGAALGFALP